METDKEKNQFRKDWYNKMDDVPVTSLVKDNPVPSIDRLTMQHLIDFFEDFMDDTCYDVGDSSVEDIKVTRTKNGLMLSNDWNDTTIILQNGVETNKEQPSKCNCGLNGAKTVCDCRG